MTSIVPGVNNALLNHSPPRQVAGPSAPQNAQVVPPVPTAIASNNGNVARERTFSPDVLVSEPANQALSEYLAVQNSDRREQLSQLLGLDVYA